MIWLKKHNASVSARYVRSHLNVVVLEVSPLTNAIFQEQPITHMRKLRCTGTRFWHACMGYQRWEMPESLATSGLEHVSVCYEARWEQNVSQQSRKPRNTSILTRSQITMLTLASISDDYYCHFDIFLSLRPTTFKFSMSLKRPYTLNKQQEYDD